MEPRRQSFQPIGAGVLLVGTAVVIALTGAGVGWAAGSWTIGLLVGLVAGLPAGVFIVYRRYRGYFT